MGTEVQKILTGYNAKLQAVGVDWVTKFAAGVRSRIGDAVAAARDLGSAVKSALDAALAGSPEYYTYYAGKEFVNAFSRGIKSVAVPTFKPALSMAGMGGGTMGGVAATAVGGPTVVVHVAGSVTSERDLHDTIYRELVRRGGRNNTLGLS